MIITRTPFRISLFGGGTDFPAWYRERGGCCVGFALDRYCWLTVRRLPPFFAHRHRVAYTRVETVHTASEVQHPAVRAALESWDARQGAPGLEIHHDGDLPARAGLGSSSAFAVGLLNALAALDGFTPAPAALARNAILLERGALGESGGDQDQVWAAYGGLGRIDFDADGPRYERAASAPGWLCANLVLYFTGLARDAPAIEAEKRATLCKHVSILADIQYITEEAWKWIGGADDRSTYLGMLLDVTWELKKRLSLSVSSPAIDDMYAAARRAGALGGKLLGAGGGGFLLLVVQPALRGAVGAALGDLVEVPVGIDWEGSKVVLNQQDGFK